MAPPPSSPAGWLACGEEAIPPDETWLDPRESARLARYRFPKRRTEYLLRRVTGKYAAAAALGLPIDGSTDPRRLARIALLNRVTGAPYVEVDGSVAPVDISLTDRAGYAVALVSAPGQFASGTLGIDLEIVEPRTDLFVQDFFTPGEQAWLAAEVARTSPQAHAVGANLIWSAKESALKVLMVGLRADTRTVDVSVLTGSRADGWHRLTVDHASATFPGWWRRDGAFLLTLATRTPQPPPEPLPGGVDLAGGTPHHSWMTRLRAPGSP